MWLASLHGPRCFPSQRPPPTSGDLAISQKATVPVTSQRDMTFPCSSGKGFIAKGCSTQDWPIAMPHFVETDTAAPRVLWLSAISGKIASVSASSIGVGLCAAFILYVFVGGIINYRKLPQFRGPPLAGFTRLWIFIQALKRRLPDAEMEALRKYGTILHRQSLFGAAFRETDVPAKSGSPCRFGPNLLLTDDPELLKHISAPRSRWTRSVYYDAMRFDPRRDTVFSTRDEKHHSDLRARMIGAVRPSRPHTSLYRAQMC
jgi:hypothetical protein